MKGFHLSKTKFLLAASAASFMLALGCNPSTASAAEGDATYAIATDSLTVEGYDFYTTAKPGKTAAPASNRWIRTTTGTVSLSNIPNATTLYFAKDPSPALEEIVTVSIPAIPKISSVKYSAVELGKALKTDAAANGGKDYQAALRKAFIFNASVKYKDGEKVKTSRLRIDPTLIEVKFNESGTWVAFDTAMTQGKLQSIVKDGATIYARVKADKADVKGTKTSKDKEPVTYTLDTTTVLTDMFQDAKGAKFDDAKVLKENFVRCGVSKAFKIPRIAAAPAVSVDYANHVITLKSGMNYKFVSGTGNTTMEKLDAAAYQDKALDKTTKISLGDVGALYAIRKDATAKAAESLENYMFFGDTKTLASDTEATITGEDGKNAVLTIKDTEWNTGDDDAAKAKTKVAKAYQYAIIKGSDIDKVITKAESSGSATFNYATELKIAWKSARTSAKTGVIDKALSWNSVKGNYVIVRKAADAKKRVFSSQVEIFKAPEVADTVNTWEKLTLADYGKDGFATSNSEIEKSAYATVAYKGDGKFDITAINATLTDLPTEANQKFTAKVGKTACELEKVSASNNVLTVSVKGITQADATTVVFTFPAGTIAPTKLTQTLRVDTKGPKVEKIEAKDDKFTMTIAGQIALAGSDGKLVALESGAKALADLGIQEIKVGTDAIVTGNLTVSYDAKKKKTTLTAELSKKDAASGTVTVTFKSGTDAKIKDISGNSLDVTTNTGTYTKVETEASGS